MLQAYLAQAHLHCSISSWPHPKTVAYCNGKYNFPTRGQTVNLVREDPRYPFLVKALEETRNSDFAKIHYVDADTPEECVLLHAFGFTGVQLGFEIMLEPYRSWLLAQDLEVMYAYQKRQMQMLNWRNPGEQWMLKAPAHMWGIEAILKVFPDARFVWCHRDPQKVVPSINSMNKVVMTMYAGDWSHLDAGDIGRAVTEWYAMSLEQGLAMRDKLPAELFIDCSQRQFESARSDGRCAKRL